MERDKMDTSFNLNSKTSMQEKKSNETPETAGTIAQNSPSPLFNVKNDGEKTESTGTIAQNTPSPLFSAQTETAGTIACNNTSSSSSGGSYSALG